jgi:hypothetical protein
MVGSGHAKVHPSHSQRSIPAGTKLHIRPQPTPGLAIGYRKSESLGGVWFARRHQPNTTRYTFHRIGAADDASEANNATFYSYEQAVQKALEWFQHETGAIAVKKSYTVRDLMTDYLADREANNCKSLHKIKQTTATHILPTFGDIPLRYLWTTIDRAFDRWLPPIELKSRGGA